MLLFLSFYTRIKNSLCICWLPGRLMQVEWNHSSYRFQCVFPCCWYAVSPPLDLGALVPGQRWLWDQSFCAGVRAGTSCSAVLLPSLFWEFFLCSKKSPFPDTWFAKSSSQSLAHLYLLHMDFCRKVVSSFNESNLSNFHFLNLTFGIKCKDFFPSSKFSRFFSIF